MLNRQTARRLLLSGVALVVLGALLDTKPWAWPWPAIRGFLGDHAGLISAGLPGIVVIGAAVVLLRRAPAASRAAERRRPWLLSYPGIAVAAAVVAAAGIVALVVMLNLAGSPATERAKLQIDAIKWGVGLFAAAGAIVALLLNIRRQQHIEEAQDHTERDAAERRVTEIYTKAVEQLGHDKAAVRLGGLRALERLGQDNLRQRQIIMDVICAYLRMPFDPPADDEAVNPDRPPHSSDARQELEVRLTAQYIVVTHLRMPAGVSASAATRLEPDPEMTFWPGVDIHLFGALLLNVDFRGCAFADADFRKTRFHGSARFDLANFSRDVRFIGATFDGDASFELAGFAGDADFQSTAFAHLAHFGGVGFRGHARFQRSAFTGKADFGGASFYAEAGFDSATFSGFAQFSAATFAEGGRFREAEFTGDVSFIKAVFGGDAVFDRARFASSARFGEAVFEDAALFGRASFAGGADFVSAAFGGGARFLEADFIDDAWFDDVTFVSEMNFDRVVFHAGLTFRGWPESAEAHFDGARVAPPRSPDDVPPAGWTVAPDPASRWGTLRQA